MNTSANAIPAYVAQQLKPLLDRIAELEKRVAELEATKTKTPRKERK